MNIHTHPANHHHAHHHAHDHTGRSRAFALSIALNGGFVLTEIFFGIQAHSLALLADAGHNAGDVLGLMMLAVATFFSERKASERFTYGFQSLSILATLANALVLMVAVGGIAWEAIGRLGAPEAPVTTTVMTIAAIGVVINGLSAYCFHNTHSHGAGHHDIGMHSAFLHMAMDAAISLGVVLSGAMILYTGWLWVDPLMSLVIVSVIIVSTWQLLKQSTALALHAVPAGIDAAKVRAFLAEINEVKEVHDLHIWAMSTTEVALSVHLLMPGGHPGDAFIHTLTHALENQFHIGHSTLQIEIGDDHACHTGCHTPL